MPSVQIGLSVIVAYELFYGVFKSQRHEHNLRRVERGIHARTEFMTTRACQGMRQVVQVPVPAKKARDADELSDSSRNVSNADGALPLCSRTHLCLSAFFASSCRTTARWKSTMVWMSSEV